MDEQTYALVQSRHGDIARQNVQTNEQGLNEAAIAMAFGYTVDDLASLPEKTNMGLSCGNPVAYANMNQGETVLDLGSGGGIDVLLAARKVGPEGKVFGVDMTEDMINLARKNALSAGVSNAEFIQASISSIPLSDASVNCVISNCVINLVPEKDKPGVFREIFRLLRPGGRVAISDILARQQLPEEVVNNMTLYVGCVAGASQISQYEQYLQDSGFGDILLVDTKADINLYKQSSYLGMKSCCGSNSSGCSTSTNIDVDFNKWVGSFQIYAVKPL
ncbi:S-adenosyl-L-methionine-dependent methyltransferase [Aspergillus ambiguus]|uniref:S-adenosyl-L-methionine-dependent methyltransferase n=1 Tax=Aspergillus ambiguus TaxID=176160 RepID=UPI003CCD67BD